MGKKPPASTLTTIFYFNFNNLWVWIGSSNQDPCLWSWEKQKRERKDTTSNLIELKILFAVKVWVLLDFVFDGPAIGKNGFDFVHKRK